MSETVVSLVGFLTFIVQSFIWYTIVQFYPDSTQSVAEAASAPEPDGTPSDEQNIDVINESEKQQDPTQTENDALKQQIASLRQIESQLIEDNANLNFKLQASYAEKLTIIEAKEAAELFAQKEKALAEEHLAAIDVLKRDLELAQNITKEKMCFINKLHDEVSYLKNLTMMLDRQKNDTKMMRALLEDYVRKRESDWQSSTRKLKEKNALLKLTSANLQTENQKLLDRSNLVKTELESANKEIANLQKKLPASSKVQAASKNAVSDALNVAEEQKNGESGTIDPTQTKGVTKKSDGSKIKRWLTRHSFKRREAPH